MRILPAGAGAGAGAVDLSAHARTHGAGRVPDVLAEVRRSGVRGRGGAAREVALELQRVRDQVAGGGRPGVVVANGVEGEPLSRKDARVLATVPHLVLDGAQAAAAAVGATDVVVAAAVGPGLDAVARALAERRERNWPLDTAAVHLVAAPEGFVAGQESALVAHLEGFAARPRGNGVPLARSGVGGRPTVVKNVETLAHTALVAAHGAAVFRGEGTPEDPGTLLLTLAHPGGSRVLEVAHGVPLSGALAGAGIDAGGGILLGGFHGGWVRPLDADVPLTRRDVEAVGGRLGAGVVQPVATGECALTVTAAITRYLAEQSVRQCGPCTFGMPRLAELVGALAQCRLDRAGVGELRRTVGLLEDRGACRHPDASARMVAGALTAFAADVESHSRGRCLAGRAVAA